MRPSEQPTPSNLLLASHGDSISRDMGASNYIYVTSSLITQNQSLSARIRGRGINGISYDYRWPLEPYDQTLITDAPISVDPIQVVGIPNWLIVFAGTNGLALAGHSVATEYANFKTYIGDRIAAGWNASRIVAVLMLPRTVLNYVNQVTAFNTSILGDDGGFGYKVARTDLQPVGASGANLDLTLFYDGTHPTVLGQSQIAAACYAAMYP